MGWDAGDGWRGDEKEELMLLVGSDWMDSLEGRGGLLALPCFVRVRAVPRQKRPCCLADFVCRFVDLARSCFPPPNAVS